MKKMTPQRDNEGYWTHPDFPVFGENTPLSDIEKYFENQGFKLDFFFLEDDAPDHVIESYSSGSSDISDWKPKSEEFGAFLVSIHQDDNGATALFLYPDPAKSRWIRFLKKLNFWFEILVPQVITEDVVLAKNHHGDWYVLAPLGYLDPETSARWEAIGEAKSLTWFGWAFFPRVKINKYRHKQTE